MGMGRQAKPEYQVFKASEANGDKSCLRNHAASKPLDVFLAEYQSEMEARVAVKSLKPGSLKAIKETFVKMRDHFGSTLLIRDFRRRNRYMAEANAGMPADA
jgi:hypothetical protein